MARKRMSLFLAGQEFRITSGSDEAYMRSLEADINSRVIRIKKRFPEETTPRCVLLAMLEMEDELKSLSERNAEAERGIKELRSAVEGEGLPAAPVKRPFERKKPIGV